MDAVKNYGDVMGWGHKVTFDVAGYWPYAEIEPGFRQIDKGGAVGFEVTAASAGNVVMADEFVVGSDLRASNMSMMQVDFKHIEVPADASVDMYRKGAEGIFKLKISTAGPTGPAQDLDVQPGGTYTIPGGYVIRVLQYNPAFPMRDTGKMVPILMLFVTRPGARAGDRAVVRAHSYGRAAQTDRLPARGRTGGLWGWGPNCRWTRTCSLRLRCRIRCRCCRSKVWPDQQSGGGSTLEHTLITVAGRPGFTDIVAGFGQAAEVHDVTDPNGFELQMDASAEQAGPFVAAIKAGGADVSGTEHATVRLRVKRIDNLVPQRRGARWCRKTNGTTTTTKPASSRVARVRVHFAGLLGRRAGAVFEGSLRRGIAPVGARTFGGTGGVVRVPGIPVPDPVAVGEPSPRPAGRADAR